MWIMPDMSPTKRKEAMYQPTMVIGWATEKEMRWAMLRRREKLDMRAKARERPLIARSLDIRSTLCSANIWIYL